jgi:hypothetical protein
MMAAGITKTSAATIGSTLWAIPSHPLVTFSLQLSVIAELARRTIERGEPGLDNAGRGSELFDAYGFRVKALEDGEQFHVSMLRVPFGPWQLTRANSQRDV